MVCKVNIYKKTTNKNSIIYIKRLNIRSANPNGLYPHGCPAARVFLLQSYYFIREYRR
jgi:hypothetical protein